AASQERGCVAVDTAPTYKNEAAVGRALALWPAAFVPFVIAKVPKAVTDPAQVRPTLLKSLGLLGVQCADLLLLHWPSDVVEAGTLTSVWGAMQALVAEGLARGVGVCNFTIGALELLPSPPLLVQVERHPLLPQWELAHYCAARGIVLQAHMPLGGKIGACELLAHVTVARVARECGRTAAQVLLRWNLQPGRAAITRA
ncbi:2,5-diketo-D-gluconic acid reductase A-like protein, partial [Pavlovales sp. CCMP2436]